MDWAEFVHPEDLGKVTDTFEKLAKDERNSSATIIRACHKDGTEMWAEFTASPIVEQDGNIIGFTGVTRDVTARVLIEQERQKFFLLAESSGEFVGICDLEMQPIYINPAGMQMVGLPDLAAAYRVKVQDYFFPEDQEFIASEFFPRVQRDGHGDIEIRLRHFLTGEPIWLYYYLFSIHDTDGKVLGWATVSRNITERKRAEEALQAERDLFQTVMNAPRNIHLVYLDRNFNFVRVNEAYAETCGYKPEEMIGKNHFVLYPDPENEVIFARVRDTGESFEVHDKPFLFPDQPGRGGNLLGLDSHPGKRFHGHGDRPHLRPC